jgi:hypothetical protein
MAEMQHTGMKVKPGSKTKIIRTVTRDEIN